MQGMLGMFFAWWGMLVQHQTSVNNIRLLALDSDLLDTDHQ